MEQTGGAENATDTAGITFTFSGSVDSLNLSAVDITVSANITKGAALTGSGVTRTLPITAVTSAGLATVTINKTGIEAGTKEVFVFKSGQLSYTEGLAFEAIGTTAYRVRKGSVTGGEVVIPAVYGGLPVTEIGSASDNNPNNGAFSINLNCTVYIPDSVTTINNSIARQRKFSVDERVGEGIL